MVQRALLQLIALSVMSMVGCEHRQSSSGMSDEVIRLSLQAKYTLDVEVLANSCTFGTIQSVTGDLADIASTQEGNQVAWAVTGRTDITGESGTPLRLNGRLCEDEQGTFLALRGTKVARNAQGTGACRASFVIPSGVASCALLDDLCADPVAVRLRFDECSNGFAGTFTTCVHFSEACQGVNACGTALKWVVRPAQVDVNALTCPEPGVPVVPRGCSDDCQTCVCE
ncbi:MAG: hypothetical protein VX589_17705 [Myxococcota bacterium]|nr:hypothetical protein [Myxococcota bacterium]